MEVFQAVHFITSTFHLVFQVSVMRVHLVANHLPPWSCQGCGEELLSLKQTRFVILFFDL